jgi:hypothetical protein
MQMSCQSEIKFFDMIRYSMWHGRYRPRSKDRENGISEYVQARINRLTLVCWVGCKTFTSGRYEQAPVSIETDSVDQLFNSIDFVLRKPLYGKALKISVFIVAFFA